MTVVLRRKTVAEDVRRILKLYNGAYFDAQDMSTMFQDAVGTTPVTAMEQPVGLWLDKSGNGNHATQSVTASRPVISARYNLLTKSEDFTDTVWSKTAVSSFVSEEKLGQYFTKLIGSAVGSNINRILTVGAISNLNICFLISIYSDQQRQITIRLRGTGSVTDATNYTIDLNVGINTIKIKKTFSQLADGSSILLVIYTGLIESTFGTIWITKADLRAINDFNMYQRVNTATDYDTVGFKKYLKFDGVDDYLNLPYMGLYDNGAASAVIALSQGGPDAVYERILSETNTGSANQRYLIMRGELNGGGVDSIIVNDTNTIIIDTSIINNPINTPSVISFVDSGTNIGLYRNYYNSLSQNYTRIGTVTLNNTMIGAQQTKTGVNAFSLMSVYGLCITKSALSDSERRRIERLLAYNSGAQI